MIWWLVAGLVLLGVVLLGLVVRPVLVRLPALRRAALRGRRSVSDAQALQASVAHLHERLARLAGQAAQVPARLSGIGDTRPPRWRNRRAIG